jgi:hypothetical protein
MHTDSQNNFFLNNIIFLIIASFLFTRVLVFVGLPSSINHIHYLLIFMSYLWSLAFIKDSQNISLNKLIFLFVLFILVSTLYNKISKFNFIVYTLIILEPFFYYTFLIRVKLSLTDQKFIKKIIILFSFLNTLICYIQYFIYNLRNDDVQGLFINLGAGHHVAGFVATLTATYVFFLTKLNNYIKFTIILILVSVNILSDAKQVVLSFVIALFIFYLIKFFKTKNITYILKILFNTGLMIILIYILYSINKVYFSPYFSKNIDEIKEGLDLKFSIFELFKYYHYSYLNNFFGLGPGQTTSRLAIMIPDYQDFLFFNFSINELTNIIWIFQQSNYITATSTGSSLFAPFFFWGGIYGDIGSLGVLIYLILWQQILKLNEYDEYSIFLVILVLLKGIVFNWPEEPPFILLIVSLLAIRFYDIKNSKNIENL